MFGRLVFTVLLIFSFESYLAQDCCWKGCCKFVVTPNGSIVDSVTCFAGGGTFWDVGCGTLPA